MTIGRDGWVLERGSAGGNRFVDPVPTQQNDAGLGPPASFPIQEWGEWGDHSSPLATFLDVAAFLSITARQPALC